MLENPMKPQSQFLALALTSLLLSGIQNPTDAPQETDGEPVGTSSSNSLVLNAPFNLQREQSSEQPSADDPFQSLYNPQPEIPSSQSPDAPANSELPSLSLPSVMESSWTDEMNHMNDDPFQTEPIPGSIERLAANEIAANETMSFQSLPRQSQTLEPYSIPQIPTPAPFLNAPQIERPSLAPSYIPQSQTPVELLPMPSSSPRSTPTPAFFQPTIPPLQSFPELSNEREQETLQLEPRDPQSNRLFESSPELFNGPPTRLPGAGNVPSVGYVPYGGLGLNREYEYQRQRVYRPSIAELEYELELRRRYELMREYYYHRRPVPDCPNRARFGF
jgi:hypothetical protein